MRRLSLFAAVASTGLALCILRGYGQVPAASPQTSPGQQVLVLANHTTLVGTVDRVGDEYRVRRGVGEVLLPANQALRVCDSLVDALAYLRSRTNLRDPQERMRLARWCRDNGLTEQACVEASAAVELAPRYQDALILVKELDAAAAARTTTDQTGSRFTSGKPLHSGSETAIPAKLSNEALGIFTRRVQPLLFNGCGTAACHGKPDRGGFELAVPAPSASATPIMTQRNLHAALALVERNDSTSSPLLHKALEIHGGAKKPPLPGPESPAYKTLEAWVHSIAPAQVHRQLPSVVHTTPEAPIPSAPMNAAPQVLTPTANQTPTIVTQHVAAKPRDNGKPKPKDEPKPLFPKNEGLIVGSSNPQVPALAKPVVATPPATTSPPPAPPAVKPADAFDPAIFNHKFHPGRH